MSLVQFSTTSPLVCAQLHANRSTRRNDDTPFLFAFSVPLLFFTPFHKGPFSLLIRLFKIYATIQLSKIKSVDFIVQQGGIKRRCFRNCRSKMRISALSFPYSIHLLGIVDALPNGNQLAIHDDGIE